MKQLSSPLEIFTNFEKLKNDAVLPCIVHWDHHHFVAVYRIKNNKIYVAKLAKINKNVSCHIARHSFGNIAGDKIPIQMLQKLYRHSDIQTTIGYQSNFMFKDTDEALEAVIGSKIKE